MEICAIEDEAANDTCEKVAVNITNSMIAVDNIKTAGDLNIAKSLQTTLLIPYRST